MAELRKMTFSEYAAIPAISASALKGVGRISPAHLNAYLVGQIDNDDSDDKRFGRAMHSMILEPDEFAKIPVAYPCSAVLSSGKRKGEKCGSGGSFHDGLNWFCGQHKPDNAVAPVDFVTADEMERLSILRKNLKKSPANEFLARKGYSEAVVTWRKCGFDLKTRIDRIAWDEATQTATIVDLKKCRVGKATDELMRKEVYDRGYHIQAGFNVDAAMEVYGDDINVEWFVVFIEDDYPFCSNILQADQQDIEIGMRAIVTQLTRFRDCMKRDDYYGYTCVIDRPHEGILPTWYKQQMAKGE